MNTLKIVFLMTFLTVLLVGVGQATFGSQGAVLSGHPLELASALRKLEAASRSVPMDGSPATAHLFIVNPFGGPRAPLLDPPAHRGARCAPRGHGARRDQARLGGGGEAAERKGEGNPPDGFSGQISCCLCPGAAA